MAYSPVLVISKDGHKKFPVSLFEHDKQSYLPLPTEWHKL